jgi:uncharacterized OB-fold protein
MSYLPDDVPGPLPDPDDEGFWRHCDERRLKFRRCTSCGHVQHPPLHFCPRCMETAHDWVEAPAYGEVFTYTITHHPGHQSVKPVVPYNVIVVDFPELGHIRLVSNLVDGNDIAIGMKVQLVWQEQGGRMLPRFRRFDQQG